MEKLNKLHCIFFPKKRKGFYYNKPVPQNRSGKPSAEVDRREIKGWYNLLGVWGVSPQQAGKPARLSYLERNGSKISFDSCFILKNNKTTNKITIDI